MKKFRSVIWLLVLVFIVASITGCGRTEPAAKTEAQEPEKQTLRIGVPGDQGGFDPATGTTDTPQQPIKAAYRGLFSFDENGQLHNETCKAYEVSTDGLTYTFKLRDDANWSDGVAVTAKDFVYGWKRNLVPELKAAYADLMNGIVNFDACIAGEKKLDEFGIRAVDDKTLEVKLSRPQPYFPQMTTFSPFFPIREDKVPMDSSAWSAENVSEVVTNGPFKFEAYSTNEKVVLVPNKEYYEADKVKLGRIEYYFIPDPQASVASFKNGELDMVFNVPTDINETHDNKAEVVRVPYLSNGLMAFNSRHKAFSDIRVREAFTIALDRKKICEILGGTTEPLYALIPNGITNPATGKDFREEGGDLIKEDKERAKQLLAEAGYPEGKGFPKTTYLYNNDSQMHTDIAQAMQGMLKQNLNIDIELRGMEFATFRIDRNSGNHDFVRHGTSADYVDPTTWLNLYISDTQYIKKLAGYSTPEYDKLIAESDHILDPAKRFEVLHKAEELMVKEFNWIPVFTNDKQMLVKDYVKDYYTCTSGDIVVQFADIAGK